MAFDDHVRSQAYLAHILSPERFWYMSADFRPFRKLSACYLAHQMQVK